VLLPRWFYVNLYAMSSWTRTIVVPLSIFYAHKHVAGSPEQGSPTVPATARHAAVAPPPTRRLLSWSQLLLGAIG